MPARARKIATDTVGLELAHDSAELHVQGRAIYIDDMREPEGTLHVAPGYAPEGTKGRIVSCDLEAVRSVPGVVAVLTSKDIPGVNDCSPARAMRDDPILADGEVLFHGQVIFAVVAETREAARRAAKLAKIKIAKQVPAVTVEDALAQSTQDVLPPYEFRRGDPQKVIARSKLQVAGSFHVGGQEHFYLEGQVALAMPEEGGGMIVYSSTQHPTEIQHIVAKMLKIADAFVTCECRRMGGAFGGKESQAAQWAALASLAAHVTGRPAKCRLDRDDDMIMTGKRHDMRIDYAAAFDKAGRLTAVDAALLARCGYSADLSLGVNDRAMFHADNAYFYPAVRIHSRRLRTNTVSNTAFRGFGGPQGMMLAERLMDEIAYGLGLDPLDVRKRNFYAPGRDRTPYGMKVTDNILADVIGELEKTSDYRARRQAVKAFNAKSPILKKGLALTPVKFGISFTLIHLNQAGALVHLYTDGSVHLNHGGTEMGQGLFIKVAQVVAEELQIDLDRVKITATNTGKVPNTSATAASSGSDINGMAARTAAQTLKQRLTDFAATHYKVPRESVRFANNHVVVGDKTMPFAELVALAYRARVQLSATGFYKTPKIFWDRAAGRGRAFFYFAYGASCSEVSVDTLTGEYMIERTDILHETGRSLNRAIDLGQVEGGFIQGMGWLTTEELWWDHKGRLRTHAPSTYKIPLASDRPKIFNVTLADWSENREQTVHRSKAVGEPPFMLAMSVLHALSDAVASVADHTICPRLDAPATPERVLMAVERLKAEMRR